VPRMQVPMFRWDSLSPWTLQRLNLLIDDGAIEAVVELVTRGEATLRVVRTQPGGSALVRRRGSTCQIPSCP
jgi:hypothetical protein